MLSASRLLAVAVRVLPADRVDWGEAMRAELDSIEPGRARWTFTWGCVRTALLGSGLHLVAVVGVVLAAFGWVAAVDFPPLTVALDLVILVLAAVCWQGRRSGMLGPTGGGAVAWLLRLGGYLLAGGIVLVCVAHLHPATASEAEKSTGPLALGVVLASYLLGLATVSVRRSAAPPRVLVTATGCGLAAAAAWLARVLLAPPIPASVGLTLALTAIAAIAAAALHSDRRPVAVLAALLAGVVATGVIVVLLAMLSKYGPPSLIPDLTPHALTPADRIAESRIEIHDPYVAVALLGVLLATALGAASVATRRSELCFRTAPAGR